MEYRFEERELLKVEVYDIDDPKKLEDCDAQNLIGSVEFKLHEVVTAGYGTFKR